MKVKVPQVIQVGGRAFKIVMLSDLVIKEGAAGRCVVRIGEIKVDTTCCPEAKQGNFLHELVHAIDYVYCGDHLTEDTVSGLSEGWLQFLKQLGIELEFDSE